MVLAVLWGCSGNPAGLNSAPICLSAAPTDMPGTPGNAMPGATGKDMPGQSCWSFCMGEAPAGTGDTAGNPVAGTLAGTARWRKVDPAFGADVTVQGVGLAPERTGPDAALAITPCGVSCPRNSSKLPFKTKKAEKQANWRK
jgi:hypothetical protein